MFDATRESVLSSTVATGVVVERPERLFVYDIIIPQRYFEWGRLYDIEVLVVSVAEGGTPFRRQQRYSLINGGWVARAGVEDLCFDEPLDAIPNQTEDDVWGPGLPPFYEDSIAVFPIDRDFDPASLFRDGLRLAPREKVTMGVSYRGLYGSGGTAIMLPHLDGRPLEPRWYVTAHNNFHRIAHRELFEFEAPETPGLHWLYVSIWEDPFLVGENENRVRIEGINTGAPGYGVMLPIIVE